MSLHQRRHTVTINYGDRKMSCIVAAESFELAAVYAFMGSGGDLKMKSIEGARPGQELSRPTTALPLRFSENGAPVFWSFNEHGRFVSVENGIVTHRGGREQILLRVKPA